MEQSKVPPEAQSGGVELSLATKVQTLRADLVKERARAVAASEHFYAEQQAALQAFEDLQLQYGALCKKYERCRETVIAQLARLDPECERKQPWEAEEVEAREKTLRDIVLEQQEQLRAAKEENTDFKRKVETLLMKAFTATGVNIDLDHPAVQELFDLLDNHEQRKSLIRGKTLQEADVRSPKGEATVPSVEESNDVQQASSGRYLKWMYAERKSGKPVVV